MNTENIINKKCRCDDELCRKCLAINCEDDTCSVHKIGNKIKAKEQILQNLSASKKKKDIRKFAADIERLKGLSEVK